MLYCAAMIYPIFYENNKKKKYLYCAMFLLCILMTLSMTAMICTTAFFAVKTLFDLKNQGNRKKIKICIMIFAVAFWILYTWEYGSHITLVDTIFQRAHKIVNLSSIGEISSATSGRSEIWKSYMAVFYENSILKKIFGTGVLNYYYMGGFLKFSHNSYIDMLLYMGILPLILFFLYTFHTCKVFKKNHYQEYLPLLMIKVVYLLTAVSVSAFPSVTWWVWAIL